MLCSYKPLSRAALGIRKVEYANEKPLKHCCLRGVHLVRLAGIEPTTPWFVAKYSIQLSYSR